MLLLDWSGLLSASSTAFVAPTASRLGAVAQRSQPVEMSFVSSFGGAVLGGAGATALGNLIRGASKKGGGAHRSLPAPLAPSHCSPPARPLASTMTV